MTTQTLLRPTLTFAPLAWLKLQYFCHRGDNEIGGFAVSAFDDPLYIEEFVTVRQDTTPLTVSLRDDAVADYFDRCVDRRLPPDRFARIWLHTHPGESARPSATDEETFTRVFGHCDWAVMAIVSRSGNTMARLSFTCGPRAAMHLPWRVDWAQWPAVQFEGPSLESLVARWEQEYLANINVAPTFTPAQLQAAEGLPNWREEWSWLNDEQEMFDPFTQEVFDDEFAIAS